MNSILTLIGLLEISNKLGIDDSVLVPVGVHSAHDTQYKEKSESKAERDPDICLIGHDLSNWHLRELDS